MKMISILRTIILIFFDSAEYGWCLNEDGYDQNKGQTTIQPLPNSFSSIDCIERCLTITNITGCEYDEGSHGCAYHTMPVSSGSGDRRYYCWLLNNGNATADFR